MADMVFNIARGCAKYYYYAVENSVALASAGQFTSTANSAFIVVAIDANGATDDALRDFDDLAALLASTPNEVTNSGYARKTLTETDLAAVPAPDDTNNRLDLDMPDQTWTGVAAGTAWTDLLVCFDPDTTAGTDSTIIPVTCHDFAITPDGSDINAAIAAAGFYRSA